MIYENGEVWVVFPIVKEFEIVGTAVAMLKNDRTYVDLKNINPQHPFNQIAINAFQKTMNNYGTPIRRNNESFKIAANERCGFDGTPACNIDTVILDPPHVSGNMPVLFTFEGVEGGGGCNEFGDCNSNQGGYSGGGGSDSSTNNIDTDDLKNYPCAYGIANELPNLNNDLAQILSDTFGNSDKVNITFKAKTGMGDADGERSEVSYKDGIFNSTISLNDDILNYASKEYILVTMYHEIIHAYLGYQASTLPYDQYISKFPKVTSYQITDANGNIITNYALDKGHQNYGAFISSMTDAITLYNSTIPIDVAQAMAKWGVVTNLTNDEITKNLNERDTRNQKSIGTKCP